uniref:ASD2 domain-containing protein n=1 Tax=Caenorhabditis tropicalis TaxID=1561998 RepID=A0A1I7UJX6_9PELO
MFFVLDSGSSNKIFTSSTRLPLLRNPSRSFLPQDAGPMLHRSPSGAKRKIRQKRVAAEEAALSRPSPFLSPSSSSSQTSISPTPTETSSNYRSLIDSGDYQSILPDFDPSFVPIPAQRQNVPLSSSMSSLELSSNTQSPVTPAALPPPLPPPVTAKPTVEVHPMPTDERSPSITSSINGSIDIDIYKPKPPVPIKPKGLLIDHLNRSTSMTSLSSPSPIQHTTSSFLNNFMPTPSLINLQQGYRNPDLGSQDFSRLESTRHESIQKVNQTLSTYKKDKNAIENELDEIERAGAYLLSIVEKRDKNLAARVRRFLDKSKELVGIETNLRLQLSKLDERIKDGIIDISSARAEDLYLQKRFKDTDFLRKISARREIDYDKELAEIFTDNEFQRWMAFKEDINKLLQSESSVSYHIRESNAKLDALHFLPRGTSA